MRNLFKQQLGFFVAAVALILTAFSSAFAVSANQAEKITIAQYGHIFLYMPIYVALDKGFFKEQGLDVKLISTGGDEKTFTAIATDNAQFGVSDPTFVAIARQHGQGGRVVAGIVRRVPFSVITFHNDIKTIRQPSDFANYRIAALPEPSTCYAVIKKILQNNGHPVPAKIVQGSLGTFPAMLKAGQADMAMEFEPNTSSLTSQGGRIIYSTVGYFGDTAFTGMTVSDAYYSQHPQEIQAAVNGVTKAMKYIHSDFAGTLAVAKQEFPEIPESVLKWALQRLIDEGTTPVSPVLSSAAWNQAISLRKEIGDLQDSGSYEQNVDMKFAQKAIH
jgi:NitT/TauT family transport system substrate-binding protein